MRRDAGVRAFATLLCVATAGAADVAVLSQELGAPNVALRREAAYTFALDRS